MPKPIGMTLHAATRAEGQKQIVSHQGVIGVVEMEELLNACVATGYSRHVWVKRGRESIYSLFNGKSI
jgi:hypothetical protein